MAGMKMGKKYISYFDKQQKNHHHFVFSPQAKFPQPQIYLPLSMRAEFNDKFCNYATQNTFSK
jgi:hypothetical protein